MELVAIDIYKHAVEVYTYGVGCVLYGTYNRVVDNVAHIPRHVFTSFDKVVGHAINSTTKTGLERERKSVCERESKYHLMLMLD